MSCYDILVKLIGLIVGLIYISKYEGNKLYEIRQKYFSKQTQIKKSDINT